MIAVITGDIINSREIPAPKWLSLLKSVLDQYGQSPKSWEIYRGDSFQLKTSPEQALLACLHIKSNIKQVARLDVRLAIGIGEESHNAIKISESNGKAYIRSGEAFEALKKQTMVISSPSDSINETLNIMIRLALLTIDTWSPLQAELFKSYIEEPHLTQKQLANKLKKSQSSISEGLNRAGYDEIMELHTYYTKSITEL